MNVFVNILKSAPLLIVLLNVSSALGLYLDPQPRHALVALHLTWAFGNVCLYLVNLGY